MMANKQSVAARKLRKFPKAGTIGWIVLTNLSKNPEVSVEELTKLVLAKFPESKFQKTHLAWYKHQVRVGNYQLPKGVEKATKK